MAVCAAARTADRNVRQKARYYYMEAAARMADEQYDNAYELARKAYDADTTYAEAAMLLGQVRNALQRDSLRPELDPFHLMRKFTDRYPGDYFEGRIYAYHAQRSGRSDEALRMYQRFDSLFPDKTTELLNLAEGYAAAGRNPEALNALRKYERAEGKDPKISLRKMLLLLADADTVGALAEADSLVAYNPGKPSFYILKSNLLEHIGATDSAEYYLRLAELIDPDDGEAKMALAQYYRDQGDSVRYDKKVYESLLCESFDIDDKLEILTGYLASLLRGGSSSERGDHLFDVLTDQYPHEARIQELAAEYSAATGRFDTASERMTYAIGMDPDNSDYWERLMSYRVADDDNAGAEDAFKRAEARIEPTDNMLFILASSRLLDNRPKEAIETYTRLLHSINPELNPSDSITDTRMRNRLDYEDLMRLSSLYTTIGDAYYKLTDPDAAFRAYGNALFFNSQNVMAMNNCAYFLAETGRDLDRAEKLAQEAVRVSDEEPTYLDTLAWVYFKKGEYKLALPYQSQAVEKSADNPSAELYEHYGDILFMNGDPAGAVENWTKALELDPDSDILRRKVKHKTYFYE